MQNPIEALLQNYGLGDLIDPSQVHVAVSQNQGSYQLIQEIFNEQIDNATAQQDWQRVIALLQAMVSVSQSEGNFEDTLIAEISLLYLTFSRYYNTDLLQPESKDALAQLQQDLQNANISDKDLDVLISNVVNNLTVPNNIPVNTNRVAALKQFIQSMPNNQRVLPESTTSLDDTISNLHEQSVRSRHKKNKGAATEDKYTDENHPEDEDYDDETDGTPLWKKWWFWTLIVLIILILGIVVKLLISNVAAPAPTSNTTQTEHVAKKKVADSKKKLQPPVPNLSLKVRQNLML